MCFVYTNYYWYILFLVEVLPATSRNSIAGIELYPLNDFEVLGEAKKSSGIDLQMLVKEIPLSSLRNIITMAFFF